MKAEGGSGKSEGGKAPPVGQRAAEVRRVREMLAGGDRRSIGRANEVAALALAGTLDFGAVCAAMFDEDPVVRMRAADAVEKVSVERPAWPRVFKAEFLAGLPDFRLPEMRWHAAQILPRLDLTTDERDTLALPVLLAYVQRPILLSSGPAVVQPR